MIQHRRKNETAAPTHKMDEEMEKWVKRVEGMEKRMKEKWRDGWRAVEPFQKDH